MEETYPTPPEHERRRQLAAVVGGGTSAEAIAGIAVVTLAILGLARVLTFHTLMIGIIVAGAALFIDAVLVGGAYRELQRGYGLHEETNPVVPMRTGVGVQALGGAIAVVLGILALLGSFSATWTAMAVIVLGTALLIGTLTHGEVDWSPFALRDPAASSRPAATRALRRTERVAAFAGAIVIFFGVLSLVAIAGPTSMMPFRLMLVALLGVGIAEFLDGSAVLGRLATKAAGPRDPREHGVSGMP
jgi:hypothetical protein